ncbi:MAG: flagellar FliJ family protein [Aquabacterium sp.]|uniref:flagellar FliJ family protein n=1 Tax=Aquabacterium sp. TaxID=1872578 RepID=UPI0025C1A709|nr:flagellar FliJ family protein [Aquabacterium sp.]MBI3381728.1 flagellar FliJ family protein [Aquabacterium sp.]
MKQARTVKSLNTLVAMRDREVDSRMADMAAKQAVRDRFQRNLERMASLCASPAAQGCTSPVQALNNGHFKASVMHMADLHRQDLALHEADMAVSQQALQKAALSKEVLEQVLSRQQLDLLKAKSGQEQKRQDDMATQVWLRRQT